MQPSEEKEKTWGNFFRENMLDRYLVGGDLARLSGAEAEPDNNNPAAKKPTVGVLRLIAANYCDDDVRDDFVKPDSKVSFLSALSPAKLFNPFLHLNNINRTVMIYAARGIDRLLPRDTYEKDNSTGKLVSHKPSDIINEATGEKAPILLDPMSPDVFSKPVTSTRSARITKTILLFPFRILDTLLSPLANIQRTPPLAKLDKAINQKLYGSDKAPLAEKLYQEKLSAAEDKRAAEEALKTAHETGSSSLLNAMDNSKLKLESDKTSPREASIDPAERLPSPMFDAEDLQETNIRQSRQIDPVHVPSNSASVRENLSSPPPSAKKSFKAGLKRAFEELFNGKSKQKLNEEEREGEGEKRGKKP